MALDILKYKYRVNCVSPAMVNTEMTLKMRNEIPEESFKQIESLHPMGFGNPNDVSNQCIFLLSKASSWITGTNLIVDGGYSIQ
jgi:NAD(P)-dependent dehydrogenase (short-subunit alcohol dehydrogenase family)